MGQDGVKSDKTDGGEGGEEGGKQSESHPKEEAKVNRWTR